MQRKTARCTALSLVLALALATAAFARYNVTRECTPRLTFSGTTATAGLVVKAQAGASIEADLTLYRLNGSRQIEVAPGVKAAPPLWRSPTRCPAPGGTTICWRLMSLW